MVGEDAIGAEGAAPLRAPGRDLRRQPCPEQAQALVERLFHDGATVLIVVVQGHRRNSEPGGQAARRELPYSAFFDQGDGFIDDELDVDYFLAPAHESPLT